jgi:hypothetical protein
VIIVRRTGAVVLVLAALAVWLFMAPTEPVMPHVEVQGTVTDRSYDIAQALSDDEANEARTQGAPQQTVVNGWTARDLLTIIAKQQNEALTRDAVPTPLTPIVPNDQRIPALLGLVVLGAALAMFTSPRPRRAAADRPGTVGESALPMTSTPAAEAR